MSGRLKELTLQRDRVRYELRGAELEAERCNARVRVLKDILSLLGDAIREEKGALSERPADLEKVREILREEGVIRSSDLPMPIADARAALKALVERGEAQVSGVGRATKYHWQEALDVPG